MESINNVEIRNKIVILRSDLNVTIKDNKILDETKIMKSLKTINYLLENDNKVIIFSHLGKVKSKEDKEKNTLYPVYLRLKELIKSNVYFSKDTRGNELEKLVNDLKPKEALLVENTRYEDYPKKLESNADESLSKYWASLGDVFINDAFGTSHRKHASNYGIKKYLPSYYGFLIEEEINKLDELINKPEKPFMVIMGGAKVDDKIEMIKELIKKCDYLIVGGGIANTFIKALGYNVGNSLVSTDYINEIKKIYIEYKEKIIIPEDFIVSSSDTSKYRTLNGIENKEIIYDIGNKSIEKIINILESSKTVFINGTMGYYEDEKYKNGTLSILESLSKLNSKVFVGGGDAVSSVNKLGFENSFYYKSTGGGATLEYILKGNLPALED